MMCDLFWVLIKGPERLADHEFLDRDFFLYNLKKHLIQEVHRLLNILLRHENVNDPTIHILDDGGIVAPFQHNTHRLTFTIGRIIFV